MGGPRWHWLGLVALVWWAGGPHNVEAFGFKKRGVQWGSGRPIEFQVNLSNAPSTYSEEQIKDFVQRGLSPWADIESARLPLRVGVSINDPAKNDAQKDGANVIFWAPKDRPRTDFVAGRAYSLGTECDIELHPRAPYTLVDVQGIVMHEIGHCLGLAHSAATGIMTKFHGLPVIGHDDIVAASLRYPKSSAAFKRATATVKGKVLFGNQPLVGAMLRVKDRRTNQIVVAGFSGLVGGQERTDRSGGFELPGLPPGRYQLLVEPMDQFVASDPKGYGAPVDTPPAPFRTLRVPLPVLEAGDVHDVGKLRVSDR